jgi:hypothetical protein
MSTGSASAEGGTTQTALVNFILVAGLMVYIASFAASLGIC